MAIEGLKNILWTPPVKKDREAGGKKRKDRKNEKRKSRKQDRDRHDRSKHGKIDIRI